MSSIKKIASQIDAATDNRNCKELMALSKQCQNKIKNADNADDIPILRYFEANCYSALQEIRNISNGKLSRNQDYYVSAVLALRQALLEPQFDKLNPVFRCKILTNLGNITNSLGRFIQAIKYWDSALQVTPNFAMALGNKGIGLTKYGQILYDQGHRVIFIASAKNVLTKATSKKALWDSGLQPDVEKIFAQYCNDAIRYLDTVQYDSNFDLNQWSLGDSKSEAKYRKWCLSNCLFLSPLNDVLKDSAAARDILHLPNHTYKIGDEPRFVNYYNLLKQEYVTARYIVYEAINHDIKHLSDNDVLLFDGFDGVQFGYRREQLKTGYRLAYSLFDKIALFLNDYFSIGIKSADVTFRRIWRKEKDGKFKLHPCFSNSKNWPLRGLYYLSKDLFSEEFMDSSLPNSRELAKLRNRAEHRFLSLQEYDASAQNTDNLLYITASDFEDKVLQILSMVREALIYLSLAMHYEETLRNGNTNTRKLPVPFPSIPIERSS